MAGPVDDLSLNMPLRLQAVATWLAPHPASGSRYGPSPRPPWWPPSADDSSADRSGDMSAVRATASDM
jgi:hypothetical protein